MTSPACVHWEKTGECPPASGHPLTPGEGAGAPCQCHDWGTRLTQPGQQRPAWQRESVLIGGAALPLQNVRGEGFGTDVGHRVFLNAKVVLLQPLGCCGWSPLIAGAAHLLKTMSTLTKKSGAGHSSPPNAAPLPFLQPTTHSGPSCNVHTSAQSPRVTAHRT